MTRGNRNAKRLSAGLILVLAATLLVASHASAAFHITSFDGAALKSNGEAATQAGSHPATAETSFFINKIVTPGGINATTETMKDVSVELPPGLVGNPQGIPTCSLADFTLSATTLATLCPPGSQVGVV